MASAAAAEVESGNKDRRGSGPNDFHRLSRTGNSLYELLDLPKESSNEEIRRKYRRLALKYHPDKNPDNPEAEEMFKQINQANSILSDEKKREIYDQYGSFGLKIAEQFGDDVVDHVMLLSSGWFQCLFWSCCLLTGCYFCCCGFCCCCCFCCGKCKPKVDDDDEVPDVAEFEDEEGGGATSGPNVQVDDNVVTAQPKSTEKTSQKLPSYEEATTTQRSDNVDESTALNNGDKLGYTPDMTSHTTPKKVPTQSST